MSQSQAQPVVSLSPSLAKRYAVYFETFMTHWTIAIFGLVIAAFMMGGVTSFALGGIVALAFSIGFQRLAVATAKPLTPSDRSQVTFGERLLFTLAGLLIPIVSMIFVLS